MAVEIGIPTFVEISRSNIDISNLGIRCRSMPIKWVQHHIFLCRSTVGGYRIFLLLVVRTLFFVVFLSDFPRDDVMKKLSDFRRHTGPGRGEADFMSLLFWPHFPFPFKSPCRSLRAYLEHGTTTHQANYFGYPSISVRVVASSGCIC